MEESTLDSTLKESTMVESTLLVKDVLEGIENKTRTVQQVADLQGRNKKTISNKLVQLGFVYDKKTTQYDYTGTEDIESVYAIEWESLFVKRVPASRKAVNTDSPAKQRERTVKESIDTSNSTIISTSIPTNVPTNGTDLDNTIGRLLSGESNTGRKYRGFYFDADILEVIDTVPSGGKSDLVNAIIRRNLQERGLL